MAVELCTAAAINWTGLPLSHLWAAPWKIVFEIAARTGAPTRLLETATTENLIYLLNPKIHGWANHFRYSCAKKTFSYIDYQIYKALWCWVCRRHPGKPASWIKKKYFRSQGLRNWIFFAKPKKGSDTSTYVDLFAASSVAIKRHIKIKAEATPYDPRFAEYFEKRGHKSSKSSVKREQSVKIRKLK